VELGGFGKLDAPFLTERRTRGLVQRCVAGNPGSGLDVEGFIWRFSKRAAEDSDSTECSEKISNEAGG
jgi:hypothetical protein